MIKDIQHVVGRGWIVVCDDQDFKVGDKISLEVTGIERLTKNSKTVGLIIKNEINGKASSDNQSNE